MDTRIPGGSGRILASAALASVVLVGALFAVPRILSANPPDPPPSQEPSRPPSATPDPTGAPVGLEIGPKTIVDEQDGYRFDLPDGWYTNAPGSGDDAFRWISPDSFDPATADGWTVPISISMQVGGSFGPGGRIVSTEPVTVAGLPALRMEVQGEAGGFIPPNALRYVYLIAVDGDPERDVFPGRWILAVLHGEAGDYEANQGVLDRLVESLEVLD